MPVVLEEPAESIVVNSIHLAMKALIRTGDVHEAGERRAVVAFQPVGAGAVDPAPPGFMDDIDAEVPDFDDEEEEDDDLVPPAALDGDEGTVAASVRSGTSGNEVYDQFRNLAVSTTRIAGVMRQIEGHRLAERKKDMENKSRFATLASPSATSYWH